FHDVVQEAAAVDPFERSNRDIDFERAESAVNDATARLQHALDDAELRADAAALQAIVLWQKGQTPKAKAMIERALKADAKNGLALLYEAVLAFERGDWNRAEAAIGRVLAKNGSSAVAHLVRARILEKRKRLDDARNEREAASRSDANLFLAAVERSAVDLR